MELAKRFNFYAQDEFRILRHQKNEIMIYSMTGFGKSVAAVSGSIYEIEIKSVNHRFLEISPKLPYTLQNLEYEIRELIRSKINRGKIYLFVSLKNNFSDDVLQNVDLKTAESVINSIQLLKDNFEIKEEIKLSHILLFKEIFNKDSEELNEEQFSELKKGITSALDSLMEMRRKEGVELKKDIESKLNAVENSLVSITALHKENLQEYLSRFRTRANELLQNISINSERLDEELALLSEKSDISEEIVRLESHLKYFRETLNSGKEVGRKLNFVCQELHREANTISSKSIAAEVIHHTVSMREDIERIREQVQNIE